MGALVTCRQLVELGECSMELLKSRRKLKTILLKAALAANAKIIEARSYAHAQGIGCVVIIRESHILVTTFPAYGMAVIDIRTCGTKMKPGKAIERIAKELHAKIQKIIQKAVTRLPAH